MHTILKYNTGYTIYGRQHGWFRISHGWLRGVVSPSTTSSPLVDYYSLKIDLDAYAGREERNQCVRS
jgi:hypothetical protein